MPGSRRRQLRRPRIRRAPPAPKGPVQRPATSGIAPGFRREPLQTLGLRNFRPPNRPSRRRCLLCCRQSIAEPLAVGRLARSPLEKRNGCKPNARATDRRPALSGAGSSRPCSCRSAYEPPRTRAQQPPNWLMRFPL
jgi:hypothetical protein